MTSNPQGTILGHPKGLFVLFFTEMWERFNYYGMRALLMLYMINYFKWPQEDASGVYKWFTALVYLTPLVGGFLADKYLGNKWAIILGAGTMAIGQFCMAVSSEQFFFVSLGLLIVGNGLFKPNMATQVGRLYPPNDPRRDSAYTIFYMGINLGAFIAPLVCAALRQTKWGYSAGFAAAGVGMLIGLFTYLLGLRWVQAVPADVSVAPTASGAQKGYLSEQAAQTAPSVLPLLARIAPQLMIVTGLATIVVPWVLTYFGILKWDDAVAYSGGGGIAALMGWAIMKNIAPALRDRVFAVYLLGVFVIFFWGAFEQAGNAMNIFADKTTNRYISEEPPAPSVVSTDQPNSVEPASRGGITSYFNPAPTEWFQSINALAIFVLGPVFAWLWVFLPRFGINFSIPAKMGFGVFFQGLAFALMVWSIRFEAQPSSTLLVALPPGTIVDGERRIVFRDAPDLSDDQGHADYATAKVDLRDAKVIQGGRIQFDEVGKKMDMTGVLADTDRDRLLRATAPPHFVAKVRQLALDSAKAKQEKGKEFTVQIQLETAPLGFDLRYAGLPRDAVRYDAASRALSTSIALTDRDYKSILVAGAEPTFRDALNKLYVDSARFKVSSWWLFWFYILCTIGELCLSPVGLSMVSKLAPAAYATMMMGIWHVMIFFGNYTAGQLGEVYGTIDPGRYFAYISVSLIVVSIICFLLAKKISSLMHGVR